MKRYPLVAVMLTAACASSPGPGPKPGATIKPPSGATVLSHDEAWQQTEDIAYFMSLQPACSRIFYALSGFRLSEILEDPWWVVLFPDTWPLFDEESDMATAQAVCLPPVIAMRPGFLMMYGPLYGADSYLHEVMHIATCWRLFNGELNEQQWQEIAQVTESVCMRSAIPGLMQTVEKPERE